LCLRVSPGARSNAIVGKHGKGWKVRVTAAPEDGKANDAVLRLLAERDALRVLKAFSRTSDPRVRRAIAQLVESVADQQPPAKSSTVRPAAAKRRERRPRTSGTQA